MTKTQKSKQEKLKEAELKEEELKTRYTEHVTRMQKRIDSGEKLEIKPFENWIRKVIKVIDGQNTEIIVAGDTGETKREKFKRLVDARMKKTLDAMEGIINLSSPQYESTPAEHEKVVNALRLKVLDIENSFKSQIKEESKFSL